MRTSRGTSVLLQLIKTVVLSCVARCPKQGKMRPILRPLQKLALIYGRLKRQRYLQISVAKITRETVSMTVTLTRRTFNYRDTGESGEAYDLEHSGSDPGAL